MYNPCSWEPWSCDQCIRKKKLGDTGKKDNKHPSPTCLPTSTRKANPPPGKFPLAPLVFMWSVSTLPGKHVSQPFKPLSPCYLGIPCSNCPFQLYAVILRVMPSTCYWTLLGVKSVLGMNRSCAAIPAGVVLSIQLLSLSTKHLHLPTREAKRSPQSLSLLCRPSCSLEGCRRQSDRAVQLRALNPGNLHLATRGLCLLLADRTVLSSIF